MICSLAFILAVISLALVVVGLLWSWLERPMICTKCGTPLDEDGFCYGEKRFLGRRQS